MIIPIESKLYMDGDRLMLHWSGCRMPEPAATSDATCGGGGGTFTFRENCSGTVDVTAHIEQIVRRIVQPGNAGCGGVSSGEWREVYGPSRPGGGAGGGGNSGDEVVVMEGGKIVERIRPGGRDLCRT